jgi:hypothetical protein
VINIAKERKRMAPVSEVIDLATVRGRRADRYCTGPRGRRLPTRLVHNAASLHS